VFKNRVLGRIFGPEGENKLRGDGENFVICTLHQTASCREE
jgi:hypothetical protein